MGRKDARILYIQTDVDEAVQFAEVEDGRRARDSALSDRNLVERVADRQQLFLARLVVDELECRVARHRRQLAVRLYSIQSPTRTSQYPSAQHTRASLPGVFVRAGA